ncbi:hypothetical protein BT96DRAFT_998673 [Gymnopus androsaceus JB14]|uniref:F-box domain-containing protein n=1 Tax=Gymnopus androsaceus JB14 TaxID=1447944 RepID=A0A6A4H7V8_9AGAR|nr:hypothetical protein BT96DRAFT_998673 [Gymnopus androsaceus JB14]
MMERRVPNELVDCILDNLYFDKATLLNCALVGRAWLPSSQRRIFREVILDQDFTSVAPHALVDAYLKTTRHLDTLFAEKPYLASYVRSLELRSFTQSSKAVCTTTASLVRRLSNLNSLSFDYVHWESMPALLKAALTDICQAPSITRFSAVDFYTPSFAKLASLLSHMRNLKMLHVSIYNGHIGWNVPNSSSFQKASHPPRSIQLDELQLHNVPGLMPWFQRDWCPFETRDLNSLVITGEVDMANLQYFGTDLRELTLGYTGNLDVNLAHLVDIRSLSLVRLYQADATSIVPWVEALFKSLLNPDGNLFPLQHLTIALRINPLQPHHWDPWAAIDALLGKPEFASLKTVDFRLYPVPESWTSGGFPKIPGSVSKLLIDKLPFLEGSGKLVVQIGSLD